MCMDLDNYEYNEDNANIDTSAANQGDDAEAKYIERSQMALITIKKIKTEKYDSGSEAIVLSVVNEEEAFANLKLFYKDKAGGKMFGRNMFDGLIKIIGLQESKKISEDIKGKQVLAAISAKQNGQYTNVDVKAFFFPDNKMTTSEVKKGETETKQYNYWLKKIKEEIEEQKSWEEEDETGETNGTAGNEDDDDEFPF